MKKMLVEMAIDVPDHFTVDMTKGTIEVLLTTPNTYPRKVYVEEYIPYDYTVYE